MRKKQGLERRVHQVNIRLSAEEIAELDAICEREDRDRAYLISWFARRGMEEYNRVGSLMALRIANVIGKKISAAKVREAS